MSDNVAINVDSVTLYDYVLQYAMHLPAGESFNEDTLIAESVAPDGATYEEYSRAIGELLRDGKLTRRAF